MAVPGVSSLPSQAFKSPHINELTWNRAMISLNKRNCGFTKYLPKAQFGLGIEIKVKLKANVKKAPNY